MVRTVFLNSARRTVSQKSMWIKSKQSLNKLRIQIPQRNALESQSGTYEPSSPVQVLSCTAEIKLNSEKCLKRIFFRHIPQVPSTGGRNSTRNPPTTIVVAKPAGKIDHSHRLSRVEDLEIIEILTQFFRFSNYPLTSGVFSHNLPLRWHYLSHCNKDDLINERDTLVWCKWITVPLSELPSNLSQKRQSNAHAKLQRNS